MNSQNDWHFEPTPPTDLPMPSLGDEKENEDAMQWTYVETYDTLKEANAERKKMPVKYSNYQTSKSSGRSIRFFKCKTHVDCGSELRLSDASGKYFMTINNVQHAEPLANSCGIGYQFKDEIDTMIASGVPPVNILSTLRGKYENTEHYAYLPKRKQIASYKASKSHSQLDTIQAVKQWGHAKLVDTYDAFQGLSPDSNELITLNVFSVTAKLMMTKKWFLLVGLPYLVLDTLEI